MRLHALGWSELKRWMMLRFELEHALIGLDEPCHVALLGYLADDSGIDGRFRSLAAALPIAFFDGALDHGFDLRRVT